MNNFNTKSVMYVYQDLSPQISQEALVASLEFLGTQGKIIYPHSPEQHLFLAF